VLALATVASAQYYKGYNGSVPLPLSFSSSGPTQLMARSLHYTGAAAPDFGPRASPTDPIRYQYFYNEKKIAENNGWNGYAQVQNGDLKVHVVYYVDSLRSTAFTTVQRSILEGVINHIDCSGWFNVLTKYYNRGYIGSSDNFNYIRGISIGNTATFDCRGTWTNKPSNPCFLLSAVDSYWIIDQAITNGLYTPTDNNIVALINTIPDLELWMGVDKQLGQSFCGYHANYYRPEAGQHIAFVVTGVPSPTCTFVKNTPNDVAIDNLVIHLAHEMAETFTDPNPCPNNVNVGYYGWCDDSPSHTDRYEIADKCEAVIPYLQTTLSGASFNTDINGNKHILPALWDFETSSCKVTESSRIRGLRSSLKSNFCLTTFKADGSTLNALAKMNDCVEKNSRQYFRHDPTTNQIKFIANGLCLGVSGSGQGATLQQQACTGASNQKWNLDTTTQLLKPFNSNLCAQASSSTNGATVTLQTCNGSLSQKWFFQLIF